MYVSALAGYKVVQPGIFFQGAGKPGVTGLIFGTREKNIYSVIYDVLSGEQKRPAHKRLRSWKGKVHHGSHADPAENGPPAGEKNNGDHENGDAQLPARRLEDVKEEEDGPTHSTTTTTTSTTPEHYIASLEYVKLPAPLPTPPESGESGESGVARYLADEPQQPKQPSILGGPGDMFRSIPASSWLEVFLPEEMMLFVAFMLATGVWIGTGTLLMLHTFLGKTMVLM